LTGIDIAYTGQCVPPDFLPEEEFSHVARVSRRNAYRLCRPGKPAMPPRSA
jgi:hypothetical protein